MLAKQLLVLRAILNNKFFFSRLRRSFIQKDNDNIAHSNSRGTDLRNFDILQSLGNIKVGLNLGEFEMKKQVYALYRQNDEKCIKVLRNRQEELIVKISQGEECFQELRESSPLKIAVNFRFRRWGDIKVTIDNCIQTLKYQKNVFQKAQEETLALYNQLCGVFIMSDHDRLYQLLNPDEKEVEVLKKKRTFKPKERNSDFGFDGYQFIHEKILKMNREHSSFKKYCQILLMKTMGFFVLGMKKRAIDVLGMLINCEAPLEIKEKTYLMILTSLSLSTPQQKLISETLWRKVMNQQKLSPTDITELSQSCISTEMCQVAVKQFLETFRNLWLNELPPSLLASYGRILFLICENYYLQGKEEEFNRMYALLNSFEDKKLNFLLRYLRLGQLIDQGSFDQAEPLLQSIIESDQRQTSDGRSFFDPDLIEFDLLRVNIMKMAQKICRALNQTTKAEEYQDQAAVLQCRLGVYTICEPQEQDMMQNDWRRTSKGRVPYYYIPLGLESVFPFEMEIYF